MPRRVALFNGDKNDGRGGMVCVCVSRVEQQQQQQLQLQQQQQCSNKQQQHKQECPEKKLLTLMTSPEGPEKKNSKVAMAVEFDHMYIGCSDSKASIGRDIELQHLKGLVLLHLDLIQQQQEQLAAKDKQITTLKDENENLRSKLERMDRRVSLSQQRRPSEASTNTEHEKEPEVQVTKQDESVGTDDDFEPFLTRFEPIIEKCLSTPLSNKLAALSIKTLPSTNIIASPTRYVTLSSKSVSPSSSKALSPSSITISPNSKGGSPNSKCGSPNHKVVSQINKVASPDIIVASPNSKVGCSEIKVGSPPSKPGSPNCKPESPITRSVDSGWQINLPLSPVESLDVIGENLLIKSPSPFKPSSPSSRPGSTKPVSPASKTSSPPYKAASPPSRIGSPSSKPGSPTGTVGSPPGKVRTPPGKPVSPSQKLSSPFNKIGSSLTITKSSGKIEIIKKVSPKILSPKLSPRERPQRESTESIQSEPESVCEGSLDVIKRETREATKIPEKRDRPILKRRSESESEVPAKKAKVEELSPSVGISAGPTDHNLRSRDKPKEKGKETVVKHGSPVPTVDRPCTPTSRAAALEAKKLRQKLLLKGQPPSGRAVRGEGILNTSVAYYLPYGALVKDPNPEEECFQSQVEIPQWGTRVLTSLYVMEGTENLEDEVFLKRHAKPEQDEKRRKRWDLQRMREQRHYERLRERYESRQNTSEPEASGYRSLWPNPESAHFLLVDDCIPVCAFGQPMARIPPQEFALPWLSGRGQEGICTRRRKRP
ncbi:hypothetical protein Pmani_018960 [Petrolisthes manimaculis]|uniref:PEHE domain-containing protein n=1 Tax=Petrolisthes manimaculis TaxID=1843537 RepID=A0AAE1PLG2_9EUCA|nr:hypothetical protein Pmani_018960 [Petrolisthes manimaculis]